MNVDGKILVSLGSVACVRCVTLACTVDLSYMLKLLQCLKLHCIRKQGEQELARYTAVTMVVRMTQLQHSGVTIHG
jgi:hypothetical protein